LHKQSQRYQSEARTVKLTSNVCAREKIAANVKHKIMIAFISKND